MQLIFPALKSLPNFRVPVGVPGVMCHVSAPGPVLLRGDGHRVLDPDLPPVPHPVSPVQRSVQYTNLARKTRNVRKVGKVWYLQTHEEI